MKKLVLLLSVASSLGGGAWWVWPAPAAGPASGATAVARRGDFKISVAEQGAFAAKESVPIKIHMEGFHNQLTIMKVSDSGSFVKKGDVVLELDASELLQQKQQAEVDVQTATNDVVQATQDLNIQLLQNRIDLERAQYSWDAAVLKLKKYQELEAPKLIKEAEAKIREAVNSREEMTTNHKFLLDMKKEDLVSDAEVRRAELAAKKAESDLEIAELALQLMKKFEHPLEAKRLANEVTDTKSFLDGKKSATEALSAQKRSALLRAESSLKQKKTMLDKLTKDMDQTVILAPVDGIVLYGDASQGRFFGRQFTVAVGEKVNPHFTLLTIPDLSAFKVKLGVSEADVNKLKPGLSVTIRPEALPDAVMTGTIKSVGSVPSPRDDWTMDPTRSRFDVDIAVDGVDPRLKPGMKGRVDIAVDEVKGVIYVPLDAVFEKDGKTFCYVMGGSKPDERKVKVGRTSADFAEIAEGLAEGEKVALFDPTKK
ncbi:MAG: efflux RND transporter periplasmic adaptor subunit [Planctomycetes bacterium]|nr:efflux RND transporter periplasmic adaptor subunit [Planctomycetota bacterium]